MKCLRRLTMGHTSWPKFYLKSFPKWISLLWPKFQKAAYIWPKCHVTIAEGCTKVNNMEWLAEEMKARSWTTSIILKYVANQLKTWQKKREKCWKRSLWEARESVAFLMKDQYVDELQNTLATDDKLTKRRQIREAFGKILNYISIWSRFHQWS